MLLGINFVSLFRATRPFDRFMPNAGIASTVFTEQDNSNPNWNWYQEKSINMDSMVNQLIEVGMEDVRDAVTDSTIESIETVKDSLNAKSASELAVEFRTGAAKFASLARLSLLGRNMLSKSKKTAPVSAEAGDVQPEMDISMLLSTVENEQSILTEQSHVTTSGASSTLSQDYAERIQSLQDYVDTQQYVIPRLPDVKLPDASTFVELGMLRQHLANLDKKLAVFEATGSWSQDEVPTRVIMAPV